MHNRVAPVEKIPGVCGGDACLTRTRIPVWVLEQFRRYGAPEQQVLDSYPTITAEMLHEAWAYASDHPAEIDQAIYENEAG